MAKFALPLLALLLLLGPASATSVEIETDSRRCSEEIDLQRLSSCRQYLRDGSKFNGDWREEFPQCCEELEQINRHCRCHAVKQLVREHRGAGEVQGREMREMVQTAQSLPSLCRISPHYCQNIEESF